MNETKEIKIEEKNTTLEQFVYEYAKNHIYISKKMIAGIYVSKYNPEYNRLDSTEIQMRVKRKIQRIFMNYKHLGISERYGQNTVKINRDRLKEFTLKDITDFKLKN